MGHQGSSVHTVSAEAAEPAAGAGWGAWAASADAAGAAGSASGAQTPAVLLITRDAALVQRVERLVRAADVAFEAAPGWSSEDLPAGIRLVLVGSDLADAVAAARTPGGAGDDTAARVEYGAGVERRDGAVGRARDRMPDQRGVAAAGVPCIVVSAQERAAQAWQAAALLGAEEVVTLPQAESWLISRLIAAGGAPPPRANVVGVIGGRGGAGASVLAGALARTAATLGRSCVLLDADPLGAGSDLLLGAEGEPGLRWPDLAAARGRLQPDDLLRGLPIVDGVPLVSWDRGAPREVPVEAMRAVLDAAGRGVDAVIVDLPRALDPAATAALEACHLALLVVPAEVRACVSGQRLAALLRSRVTDVRVVVRGPAPTGLTAGAIAEALGLPLAGWLAPDRGLAAALDRGEPPGLRSRSPLATFCRQLLQPLGSGPIGGGNLFPASVGAGWSGAGGRS